MAIFILNRIRERGTSKVAELCDEQGSIFMTNSNSSWGNYSYLIKDKSIGDEIIIPDNQIVITKDGMRVLNSLKADEFMEFANALLKTDPYLFFKGIITEIMPVQTINGNNKEWKKQDIIVKGFEEKSDTVLFTVWNHNINESLLKIDNKVDISYQLVSKESNGRWYTNANINSIEPVDSTLTNTNIENNCAENRLNAISKQIVGELIEILPLQVGVSERGAWKRQNIILRTFHEKPKNISIKVNNDKLDIGNLKVGMKLYVSFNLVSKESNKRWHTDVEAWNIRYADQRFVCKVKPPSDSESKD